MYTTRTHRWWEVFIAISHTAVRTDTRLPTHREEAAGSPRARLVKPNALAVA